MKKLLTISILAVMLILATVTGVNATTNDNLADTLYNMAAPYGARESDKVKIERYLADYPVTEDEANAIVAKAEEAVAILEAAGVTNYKDLSKADKDRIKQIANEAASIIDVTLVFKTGGGSDMISKIRRRYFSFSCNMKTLSAFEAPLPDKTSHSVYMMGVFQNAEMVETVRDEVLKAFMFQPFIDRHNLDLMKEIQSCRSVAIHVRKGKDYMSRIWYQQTCPIAYYQKAIKLIEEKIKDPRFYVFTDNPEWVKENFRDFEYTLVQENPVAGYGSHFDMQLMSLCQHNILSNSTYSWWGAFLNRNQSPIVICPEIWFNPNSCKEYTSRQIRCKGWITL